MPQAQPSHTSDDRTLYARRRLRGSDVLVRSAVAQLLRRQVAHNQYEAVEDVIRHRYGNCPATAFYTRAAVSPAATTTATWAAELVQTSLADFLSEPPGASAFAALAAKAMSVTLPPGVGVIKIPSRASPQVLSGSWVAENGPKPVTATPLTTVSLAPFKVACISVFSEELIEYGLASIESVVTEVLRHDLGALLDSSLLDSTAASAVRPAGLLNGVTPITASVMTPSGEAMAIDLKALASAVSSGNPDARPVYLASVTQAPRMAAAGYEVIASNYLAANSVVCVDASAIAMMASPPEFKLSRDAVVHMEDTTPLALGTGAQGSGVLAVPMHSTFQSDTLAIRSAMRAGWVKRRSGAAAIVGSVTW